MHAKFSSSLQQLCNCLFAKKQNSTWVLNDEHYKGNVVVMEELSIFFNSTLNLTDCLQSSISLWRTKAYTTFRLRYNNDSSSTIDIFNRFQTFFFEFFKIFTNFIFAYFQVGAQKYLNGNLKYPICYCDGTCCHC